jgi:putative ABC transport system permease protein
MSPLSLLLICAGGALGWFRLLGTSRRRPLNRVWFAVTLAIALALSFLPAAATQGLSYNWLFGVGFGAYARAVHVTGRMDVWRRAKEPGHGPGNGPTSSSAEPTGPRSAARRAMIRWAWRMFRRELPQHLTVLGLITLAVAATVVGSALATDASPPSTLGFGNANHLVQLSGSSPRLDEDITALRSRFGNIDVIENTNLDTGLSQGAELRSQNPDGPYGAPMLQLVSGQYPEGADQVAITEHLADTLTLKLGETWDDAGHALRIVGLVENPQNLNDDFALLAPGELGPSAPLGAADTVTVLFNATAAQLAATPLPDAMTAQSPPAPTGITAQLIVFAVAILALVFTGLVAVAGFAALARRRQRSLGMLAALGATERDIQLVITADGAIVGVIGAILGAAIGLAAWIAYAPHFSVSAGHVVAWTDLPWWLVVAAMVMAVACATLAAWRPARTAARTISIVSALSDRPAPPVAVYRSVAPALVLLIAAPVLLATSGGQGGHALFQLGGLLLSALGLALAAPFAVGSLAGPARRVPPAARLALRDLSRYRVRSAAALAAGSLAVLIAMLVTLITTGRYSDPIDYFGPNLPSNQLVVYAPGQGPGTGRGPTGTKQQDTTTLQQHAATIAATLGSKDVLTLDPVEADLMHKTLQKTSGNTGSLYLATPPSSPTTASTRARSTQRRS